MVISNKRAHAERWLYRLLVTVHLLPILATRWFVTLDGPSHLYSARIVRDLVLGDPFMGRFFHLSPYPEPYWLGHAVMAALLLVLPAWLVEKLIWSAAVIALAWAFRYFVRTLAPRRAWMALLVMPFLLHYAVRLGFLNFSLSIPLLFVVLAMAWRGFTDGRLNTALLAAVLTGLYFAHLSTFLLCAGILLAMVVWAFLFRHQPGPRDPRPVSGRLLLGLALPVALTLGYAITHAPAHAATSRLAMHDLWRWAWEGRCWNGLGAEGENWACILTAAPMLLAGMGAIVLRMARRGKPAFQFRDLWPLITLVSFAAYFTIPDVMAGGSSVSPRLLLFSMLFLAASLSVSGLPSWALRLTVVLVLLADLQHTRIQYASAISLGRECNELMSVEGAMRDRTVVLPLNYGANWMHSNISNYLGTGGNRVIILDHFTALAPFNPVQWNTEMLPYAAVGDFATSNRPCVRFAGYPDSTGANIDEVLTWKMHNAEEDSCLKDVRAQLKAEYRLVATSPHGDAQVFAQP